MKKRANWRKRKDNRTGRSLAAAHETLHRREVLLAKLREGRALAVEVNSETAALTRVNSYLEPEDEICSRAAWFQA